MWTRTRSRLKGMGWTGPIMIGVPCQGDPALLGFTAESEAVFEEHPRFFCQMPIILLPNFTKFDPLAHDPLPGLNPTLIRASLL